MYKSLNYNTFTKFLNNIAFLTLGTTRYPLRIYKKYARRRPDDVMEPDSSFYLQPIKCSITDTWFTHQPLGKNSIGSLAENMARRCKLPSDKKTNHSARKTVIERLLHDDVLLTSIFADYKTQKRKIIKSLC